MKEANTIFLLQVNTLKYINTEIHLNQLCPGSPNTSNCGISTIARAEAFALHPPVLLHQIPLKLQARYIEMLIKSYHVVKTMKRIEERKASTERCGGDKGTLKVKHKMSWMVLMVAFIRFSLCALST